MIPIFPAFRQLEPSDKADINSLTEKFKHYSDFQFPSLWAWDLDGTVLVSTTNNNILFRFRDYLSGQPFYSFVGENDLENTASQLIDYSASKGLPSELRLIPDEIAQILERNRLFTVVEDRDNFDYVVDIEKTLVSDAEVKSRRRAIRRFTEIYPSHETTVLEISKPETQQLLVTSAKKWTMERDRSRDRLDNEIPAMERLISNEASVRLIVLGLWSENKLIGFSIEELIDKDFAMGHFQRADYDYNGAFAFLDHTVNQNLAKLGIKQLNIQQDVGDAKLRETKLKNPHVSFLRKYTVSV